VLGVERSLSFIYSILLIKIEYLYYMVRVEGIEPPLTP
jgi:hypothetical protein